VEFAPTGAGADSGDVYLTNDGTVSPVTIAVSGTGTGTPVHSVSLSWAASISSDVAGYYVFRGAQSGGPYTQITEAEVTGTGYTDTKVTAGTTYYYVVTAVDEANNQSAYSPESVAAVPTP
jgi:fibronectin type 3 domain-containing protein